MSRFALYLHPDVVATSKPVDQIEFMGHSVPHFESVREKLEESLTEYPQLPLREADFEVYGRVHNDEYLQALQIMANDGIPDEFPTLSLECRGYEHCLPGYRYGLGGLMEAIDQIKRGNIERAYCFSLGGHHAYADHGHGYCLLNPQAAAARYAQSLGFQRILIVDWDIHHGDGTQSIFAHDSSVYCISIHSAVDLYMAKVAGIKMGTTTEGAAVGHCNLPLLDQIFDDAFVEKINFTGKFYRAHESLTVFQSALKTIPWQPDLILIFSGYDSHKDDCGGGITNWDNEDFRYLTRLVLDKAKEVACPVISSHGGGYKLPVTVAAALSHIELMAHYR